MKANIKISIMHINLVFPVYWKQSRRRKYNFGKFTSVSTNTETIHNSVIIHSLSPFIFWVHHISYWLRRALKLHTHTHTHTHTHIRETSYRSIEVHLKQVFQSVYRHELETRLSHKPWKQEIAKIPDWPRRKAVAEFRLCVWHDC